MPHNTSAANAGITQPLQQTIGKAIEATGLKQWAIGGWGKTKSAILGSTEVMRGHYCVGPLFRPYKGDIACNPGGSSILQSHALAGEVDVALIAGWNDLGK